MSAPQEPSTRNGSAAQLGPQAVAAEYQRLGVKLLRTLAEPGAYLKREGDKLQLIRFKGKVSMSAGSMPSGVLAPLLQAGQVACERGGKFAITAIGRAALLRFEAGEDGFADQHRRIIERDVDVAGETSRVRVNLNEDPIERLARLVNGEGEALIGPSAIEAGERLRQDLTRAHAVPPQSANWSRLVVDSTPRRDGLTLSEAALEARRRVDAAMRAVGPDFSGPLIDLCGFSKGFVEIEDAHALPRRSGKVILAFALRALARHYGLADRAEGKARAPMRQWGTEDYRPKLQAG